MRRGARNPDGQLSLPGFGTLPGKLRRPKGCRGGSPESRLVTAILEWSEIPHVHARIQLERVNSGLGLLRDGGVWRGAKKGTADLLGTAHGRPVAIECKVGRGRLTPEQRVFLRDFIERRGGVVFVARDLLENFVRDFEACERGRYAPPAEIFAGA